MIGELNHSPILEEYILFKDTNTNRIVINYFSDISNDGITKLCSLLETFFSSEAEDTSNKTNKLTNSYLEQDSKISIDCSGIEISNDDIIVSIFLSLTGVLKKVDALDLPIYLTKEGFNKFNKEPKEIIDKFKDFKILETK